MTCLEESTLRITGGFFPVNACSYIQLLSLTIEEKTSYFVKIPPVVR